MFTLAVHESGNLSAWEGVALVIGSLATLLAALGGFWVVIRGQHKTHGKIDKVYEHVNNVETDQIVEDGDEPTTLGQAVRQLRTESREGFARNDAVHELLRGMVEAEGVSIRSNTGRLEAHRTELDDHAQRLEKVDGALEEIHNEIRRHHPEG